MKRNSLAALAIALFLSGGAFAIHHLTSANATRPDCPGQIECPLTGKLVCRDRCPVHAEQAKAATLPSCCRPNK